MHFLGRKPYEQLPAYCKYFDVGLIPFKISELTRAVNPIKLREYLAAGLPVVSTPLPEVLGYRGAVEAADTPDTFVAALEAARAAGSEARRRRSDSMARETWPQKLTLICERLENIGRSNRTDQYSE
jgi:hypothetical protein